jgi:4-diphosphocytidyl-2-C-methyl-D-erythritol kinase
VAREMSPDGLCVTVRVPAKLNLFLAVRGVRDDGFHELVTVMQTVGLHDEMRVGVVGPPGRGHHPAARRRMGVELWTGAADGMPPVGDNLAVRAARALGSASGTIEVTALEEADDLGGPSARTVIDLRKAIPVAGGMAGGSADAAAALVALNELWGCSLDRDRLREIGAELGSDVPFCVVGGTALATGRGTALAQVLCRGTFHWVVATAHEPLSTAAVYRAWDDHCEASEIEPDAVLAALRAQDAEALGAALHNDLQEAAFGLRPELREQREALLDAGALGAVLSGSGPTLLALAESEGAARTLAAQVEGSFACTMAASSPAGGPELRPC